MVSERQPHIFVSYSRSEFNYAEAVVRSLQSAGYPVWFDNQALEPGIDWAQGIDDGLAGCDAVVLIASREAIRKDETVGKEWRHAIAHNKPLYVLAFEELILPSEIDHHAAAIIDGRGAFEPGMAKLTACLQGRSAAGFREGVPPPNRWGIPRKVPPEVRAIVVGMLAGFGWILLQSLFCMGISISSSVYILTIVGAFGLLNAGMILYAILELFRERHHRFEPLRNFLMVRRSIYVWIAATFVTGVPLILLYRMLTFENPRLKDVYRWAGRGSGKRIRVGSRFANDAQTERSITYRLVYHERDSRAASDVHQEMQAFGHQQVDGAAQYDLLLLSANTESAAVAQVLRESQRLIPIIASNIDLHAPEIKQILRFQVLDYRRRERYPLRALALMLAQPENRTVFGDMMEPTGFGRSLRPSMWSYLQPYYEATPLPKVIDPFRRLQWPVKVMVLASMIAVFVGIYLLVESEPAAPPPNIEATNVAAVTSGEMPTFTMPSETTQTAEAYLTILTPVASSFPTTDPSVDGASAIVANINNTAELKSFYGDDVTILERFMVRAETENLGTIDAYVYVLPDDAFSALSEAPTTSLDGLSGEYAVDIIQAPLSGWVLRVEGVVVHVMPIEPTSTAMLTNIDFILSKVDSLAPRR